MANTRRCSIIQVAGVLSLVSCLSLACEGARSVTIPHAFANGPIPRFENGLVLSFDRELQTVWAFNRDGRSVATVKITLPETERFSIKEAAVAPDGKLAVTGTAHGRDGKTTATIVWADRTGAVAKVVRTSPFTAFHIAFAGDGTLWAVGRVHDERLESQAGHDVMRQYGQDGRLRKTVLPDNTFPPAASKRHPCYESFLVAGGDRIGLYCATANEWVELSAAGEILGRFKAPVPANEAITGAALSPAGDLWISVQSKASGLNPHSQSTGIMRFDRKAREFKPAGISSSPPDPAMALAGSDGSELVLYRGEGTFHWFPVEANGTR